MDALPVGLALALALLTPAVPTHAQEDPARVPVAAVPADAIRVRVLDEEGHPVPSADVALRSAAKEREALSDGTVWLRGRWRRAPERTDEDGVTLLPEVAPGTWRVAAGSLPEWSYHFSEPTAPGEEVTIVLTPVPKDRLIAGTVLKPDGTPKAPAYVRFVWSDRGRRKAVTCSTDLEGHFAVLADEPGQVGALHARVYQNAYRSAAIDPFSAGTADVVLQLGEPRTLTIEIRDQHERVVEYASATFYWQLAGFLYQDVSGPPQSRGELIQWELPSVPFHVYVQARDHAPARLGPLDPEEVGSQLVVHLEAYPRLSGRVVLEGEPVQGAHVTALTSEGSGGSGATDVEGRFDLPLTARGEYRLRAWSRQHGEGMLGPLALDPAQLPDDLLIEITRPPGSIAGRVLLPPGREPGEVWLTATRGYGYVRLEADGTFLMPGLPAGPLTVRVRQGAGAEGAFRPASTTFSRAPASPWFSMSHGPTRAPDWLAIEPTFDVEVRAGETVALELDLMRPAACRLEGRIRLDGAPPADRPREPSKYFAPEPRVVLDRGNPLGDYVSRTELAADGTFAVTSERPGTYHLRVAIPVKGGSEWTVEDRVRLEPGTRSWEVSLQSGSLRILPCERDGVLDAYGSSLSWQGPGDLRVLTGYGERDEATREVFYPAVPAGTVQLFHDSEGERTVLLEAEVVAGETTVVRSP